ncbi:MULTISPECIES: rod-determining factor RdfA [Halobacterium]|uniref:Vng6319h n=4 Tax=Halobacterium salinarum TaxID=2242 RepID=F2Z6F3_HALSA|nr:MULTISPECIES: rod-determining factor RdfA [Halobacterium]AAG20950.1 Vng6319h [Halobacterium salinarum NRC-1]MBB6090539.1 hypothetical protein [Halobacterium salinarum]MCF2206758.1 hypothetical protein [Halobacterium salinarum]MCF2240106.1 hypothetical protein [Halobacterium salinarum]MDL0119625.1 hypothetical protein [Halobacterium salinarum]
MTDHCCKIGRTIATYDLGERAIEDGFDEELAARWVGDHGFPETATRPLTDWFNTELLKSVYDSHNRKAIDVHIQSEYDALQSDDAVTRGEIIDDLADDGIDGTELTTDFATRSTMYRHLTQCLGANKSKQRSNSDWESDKIEYARDTMRTNIEDVLQSLDRKGELPNGADATVRTQIILQCHVDGCSTQTRLSRARTRGFICRAHSDVA